MPLALDPIAGIHEGDPFQESEGEAKSVEEEENEDSDLDEPETKRSCLDQDVSSC